jgi:hypothetical protein
MVQLLSLFITLCASASVLARPLSLFDDNKGANIQDLIADSVLPIVTLLPKLAQPPKTLEDVLNPLFPKFGDLAAPRPPSLEPKAHGPLEDYSVAKLKSMSKEDARRLQSELIQKQWKKDGPFMDNLAFLYQLDEAFYDVGISLDPDVTFIEFKLDELANFGIKDIKLPNGDQDSPHKDDKAKVEDKVAADKAKEKIKLDLNQQLLRRYLIVGKLTNLKRYIDRALKKLIEIA